MENYKEEIQQTRVGCLGSSDARLLAQIASLGVVPRSALKRLAICKGLVPQTEIPRTAAIQAGDDLEMMVYEHLKANDERYESNPMWVSERYSRKNVRLISHPDLVLRNDERKTLYVYECKCTRYGFEETKQTYKAQLFVHYVLAKEEAKKLGEKWKVKLFLVHYSTEGLNLEEGLYFDTSRLTVKEVRFSAPLFDIEMAMDIVDAHLETMNEYYEGDDVDSQYLPENVRNEFDMITAVLAEIKERERKVEDFKKRLTKLMLDKNIKSIRNDQWGITLVNATESVSFDYKAFISDLTDKHPRKAKKLLRTYEKRTKRGAYCIIKIKDNKE